MDDGTNWTYLGFLAVIVPVVVYYLFKFSKSGSTREFDRSEVDRDLDDGIDF